MAVKWKWKPAAGGSVPAELTNKVNQLETNTVKITGDQSIAGVKTFTNKITANEGLTTAATKAIISGDLELGFGNTTAYITPEDPSTKTLKFGGRSGKGRFDLDFENLSLLKGIKDPSANFQAANKQYVDNRIKTRTETATINANNTYIINPTSGYQIVSVMVGRKRTNDGMFFFEYQTTLNKQVFLDGTTFKIYNQGNVSGFSNNEFKLVILEMKV